MSKKTIIIVGAVVALLLAGWQGWMFFEQKRESASLKGTKDPLAGLMIPEKYASDTATKKVIDDKIAAVKTRYAEQPNVWETWIAIGNLRALLEDFPGAIDAYKQSIAIQGNNILGYRNIAEVYNQHLHDYDAAAEYYRLAIENNFADAELYTALAFVEYKHRGNAEEAEKIYIQGLRSTGFANEILVALIQFYKDMGNAEKYAENARLLIQRNPANTFYRDTYAKELAAMGLKL
jgi:tetratricopeptide (TPR) repeat protein